MMMKILLIALGLIALSAAVVFPGEAEFETRQNWEAFKYQYNKEYNPEEELIRYSIFKSNLLEAAKLNAKGHATFGVTKFMDLTPTEFKHKHLMTKTPPLDYSGPTMNLTESRLPLPTSYDWRNKGGVVTPVKNQGQCGSCWSFSAVETMESVCALSGYELKKLSEQQIVSCDTACYGCSGGWTYDAYKYIIQAGGIETESEYPYCACNGQCSTSKNEFVQCKLSGWSYVTQSENENTMQSYLYKNSPLSVCVDAASWQYYQGGVIEASQCGTQLDHCVQATGWSSQDGQTAWNIRNSWGADWGNSGYLYLQFGKNTCGVAQVVTVPCVTGSDGSKTC